MAGGIFTLRTVADILHVLGYKVALVPHKVEIQRESRETSNCQKQAKEAPGVTCKPEANYRRVSRGAK